MTRVTSSDRQRGRAGAGRTVALLGCLLLLVGCGGAGAPIVAPGGAGTPTAASPGEAAWTLEVLALTNAVRADHGLPPLVFDEAASLAAYDHAWDMDVRGFFDHVNPDGEGPPERLARHGVVFQDVGENLARGHATPAAVVLDWMASPVHRANLLYPGWTHVGIAVHTGGERGPWWAQAFYR